MGRSDAGDRYVRRDVAAEPLVSRWYAWAQLVSPATAALQLARSQLAILDSFVQSPAVHAAAVRDPRMRGGPFLDLAPERAGEVRALAAALRARRGAALELAAAVGELEQLLAAEATGGSLEPLYPRVPEPLRGAVELVYDAQGRPGFRLIERLLWRAPLYDPGEQGFLLRRLEGDGRAFALSTPRFTDPAAGDVDVPVAFADPAAEALFRARRESVRAEELAERLRLAPEDAARLGDLLTDQPPPPAPPWEHDAPRVRYVGHACVLFETRATSVLVDPLVGYASAAEPPRTTLEDLPERIDVVLLTHAHQDHVVLETLLALRHRIGTVVVPRSGGGALEDPSLRLLLEALGFRRVVELDELQTLELEDGEVLGLPFLGEHGDLAIRSKLGYRVRLGGRSFVFAADSCNLEPRLYDLVRELAGPVDALFLGMECDGAPMSWLYGALLSRPLKRAHDQSRRLSGSDRARALALVESLAPGRVLVYAMGQEPWCRFITSIEYTASSAPIVESDALIAACRERGIPAERLYGCRELV